MNARPLRLASAVTLLLIALPCLAGTWHVADDGNDETGDGSLQNPFRTIGRALKATAGNAQPDTILLRRGDTFTGSLQKPYARRRITVGKRYHPYDVLTIAPYGEGARPVWKTDERYALRLANVTLDLRDLDFRGGGVYPQGLDSTIRDCTFETTDKIGLSTWFSIGQGMTVEDCVVNGQENFRCDPLQGACYDVDVPATGWYRLQARYHELPGIWVVLPDGRRLPGPDVDTPVYLQPDPQRDPQGKTPGTRRVTIGLKSRYIGPAYEFDVTPIESLDPLKTVYVRRLSRFQFYKPGEEVRVELLVGSAKTATVNVVATAEDGETLTTRPVDVPAGQTVRKELAFPLNRIGLVKIRPQIDGRDADCKPVEVFVMDTTPLPKPETYTPLGKGRLVWSANCATPPEHPEETYYDSGDVEVVDSPLGPYRQTASQASGSVGHSDANASWFAYKITVENPGKLHRIVYRYPDDHYRTALVLHYDQPRMTYNHDVGICCGGIRRISNTLRERTVYAWPRAKSFWVAIHAWKRSAPAALASIEVYEHDEQLPPLPVGNADRYFGYYHEEPRFTEWFHMPGSGIAGQKASWDRMGSYLRHAGQNLLWYSGFAYSVASYETPRLTNFTSTQQHLDMGYHSFRGMLLAGQRYGFSCIGEITMASASYAQFLPEGTNVRDTRMIAWDGVPGNQAVSGDAFYNFLHPPTRKYIRETLKELAEIYKDCPNYLGPAFRTMRMVNPSWFAFPNEHFGYGDVTAALFEKDTGIDIPGDEDPEDFTRFKTRYDYLTGPQREQWLAWRTEKVTAWLAELGQAVSSVRDDLAVYINETAALYELYPGRGMDPSRWGDIKGLRFASHGWYGPQFCDYPFPVSHTQNLRPWEISRTLFRPAQGRNKLVISPNPYMEGGKVWEIYPEKLRNQVAGFGGTCGAPESPFPYYLERMASFTASGPAYMIADGGLAYRGVCTREKQIAARFLRSLPRLDYQPSPLNLEPAFLFEGEGDDQRILFLVNRQVYPVTVTLEIDGNASLRRLDDNARHDVREGKVEISLKPFRMVAFAMPSDARVAGGSVQVPPEEIQRLTRQVRQAREIFNAADPEKLNTFHAYKGRKIRSRERPVDIYGQAKVELQAAEQALAEKRYDTADRYVRGYLHQNSPNPRGYAMPLVYGFMNRWPDGVFNTTGRTGESPQPAD